MIKIDLKNYKVSDTIEIFCDNCTTVFKRTIKNRKLSFKKHNKDLCTDCANKSGASKRPQNSILYWTDEKKKEHSEQIKNNENYLIGIQNRQNIFGENNPMYNKKHTLATKQKMSISRTGKIGENATAWKGGINTLTRRVKGFQYRNGWYKNIYIRDNFKCVKCTSTHKIEAHHIKPIKTIVNEIKNKFKNDDEAYLFLIKQNIITDVNLTNGITLCRECHIKEHINMGSHNPQTK